MEMFYCMDYSICSHVDYEIDVIFSLLSLDSCVRESDLTLHLQGTCCYID